jgi:hypothetical protein
MKNLDGIKYWVIYFPTLKPAMELFVYAGVAADGRHMFRSRTSPDMTVFRATADLYTDAMRPFCLETAAIQAVSDSKVVTLKAGN